MDSARGSCIPGSERANDIPLGRRKENSSFAHYGAQYPLPQIGVGNLPSILQARSRGILARYAKTSRCFESELQADCFSDGIQRRKARVSIGGQCAIEAFALDSGCFRNLGNSACLGYVPQGEEENARFI